MPIQVIDILHATAIRLIHTAPSIFYITTVVRNLLMAVLIM